MHRRSTKGWSRHHDEVSSNFSGGSADSDWNSAASRGERRFKQTATRRAIHAVDSEFEAVFKKFKRLLPAADREAIRQVWQHHQINMLDFVSVQMELQARTVPDKAEPDEVKEEAPGTIMALVSIDANSLCILEDEPRRVGELLGVLGAERVRVLATLELHEDGTSQMSFAAPLSSGCIGRARLGADATSKANIMFGEPA